ncbi:MAG: LysR family transcriptional regulator [Pseudomonadota bacterium]
MDDLRAIRVFDKVVELGSFTNAAEALDLSRPMASKHVAALEQTLGVTLLRRTTRRLTLTEAGERFHIRARDLLQRADEAFAEATGMQSDPSGALKVNAPVEFGRSFVTGLLCALQYRYPNISIDLTLNDRVVDLVDEGFDLAIRVGELPDSSLIARRLARCSLTLCASPDYVAKHGLPDSPAALVDHNCLLYKWLAQGASWTFERRDQRETVKVSGDFRTNYGPATVAAAVAGRGIILEPEFLTYRYLDSGQLQRVLTDWRPAELGIYAVYPRARLLPAKVRVAIDHLAEQFAVANPWSTNP